MPAIVRRCSAATEVFVGNAVGRILWPVFVVAVVGQPTKMFRNDTGRLTDLSDEGEQRERPEAADRTRGTANGGAAAAAAEHARQLNMLYVVNCTCLLAACFHRVIGSGQSGAHSGPSIHGPSIADWLVGTWTNYGPIGRSNRCT